MGTKAWNRYLESQFNKYLGEESMEKVVRFAAKDGTEYKTRAEAMDRDTALEFEEWYVKHEIADDLAADEMYAWLSENRADLHGFSVKMAAAERRQLKDKEDKKPKKAPPAKKDAK